MSRGSLITSEKRERPAGQRIVDLSVQRGNDDQCDPRRTRQGMIVVAEVRT